jgi:hypothetical protein
MMRLAPFGIVGLALLLLWIRAGLAPRGSRRRRPSRRPGYRGAGPYGPDTAPRYLAERDITDRRSEELDRELEEWERAKDSGDRETGPDADDH